MSEGRGLEPERVEGLIAEGAQLMDVRASDEYEAGHLAGARHVPFDRLAAAVAELGRGRAVIVYCRSGSRSAAAAAALAASGWEAYSIEGGLLAWAARGLPLEPEGGEVAERSLLPPGLTEETP